ncbi:MAG: hypothetical protein HUJ26_07430 [Planctomycetaceae bacterium]|nr:hypothetical protein [Planctomycetaceae bacterium]
MRQFFITIVSICLILATGFLTVDLLFGIWTPLTRPSLVVVTAFLAFLLWQSRKMREQRFQQAVDRYVHKEAMRQMDIERRREREKVSASDSRPSQIIAP